MKSFARSALLVSCGLIMACEQSAPVKTSPDVESSVTNQQAVEAIADDTEKDVTAAGFPFKLGRYVQGGDCDPPELPDEVTVFSKNQKTTYAKEYQSVNKFLKIKQVAERKYEIFETRTEDGISRVIQFPNEYSWIPPDRLFMRIELGVEMFILSYQFCPASSSVGKMQLPY